MKKCLFILLLLAASQSLLAQEKTPLELKQIFYKAYHTNNAQLWKAGIEQLKQSYEKSKDPEVLLELAQAEMGLVGTYMGGRQMDEAEETTDLAEEHLEKVIKELEKNSDGHALYAGILGFQIAFSPMKGMYLGSRSDKHIEKALSLEDSNPIAWYEKASSLYHTPSMFGGDVEKAVECFEKSVNLYEKDTDLSLNWQYLDALVWLGQAYLKHEQKDNAISTFKKCLEIEPDFMWVKMQLLPLAEKS